MRRVLTLVAFAASLAGAQPEPLMEWADSSRLGRPFSKDPSVIRFGNRYLLYYSMPAFGDGRANDGWAIGIAESRNLLDWNKVAEVTALPNESKGICAPFAKVIDGQVHLFYQTYGNGPKDSILHATSEDGLHFDRDLTNPIFHARGAWNSGRAIDAEVARFHNRWFLYAATRDPDSKIQLLTGAVSSGKGFSRESWKPLEDGPLLKPELKWEKNCIEAPTVVEHNGELFMFYAGAYNNEPQQIGCARSHDGIHWTRISDQPFLAAGAAGSWNSSESGHPGVFVDEDGRTYLFFQGNNDHGRTWFLSFVRIGWRGGLPVIESK